MEEFVASYPAAKQIYRHIMQSTTHEFSMKVQEAYEDARRTLHKGDGFGLTADCVAAAIYLVLSHHPKEKVII